MVMLGTTAWQARTGWLAWPAYAAMGYLWMSFVTFMHDATHDALMARRWQNWAFGILCMLPLMITFVSFRHDHLRHHRHNRTPRDPDAFTMGRRSPLDFIVFYLYLLAGGALSVMHFALIYPIQRFGVRDWVIHLGEVAAKVLVYVALLSWADSHGLDHELLAVWLWPLLFFSLLNSMRFIAEHYETPWDQGNLMGTRTVVSNRVHSFFWNNINWHIGHHVYPRVPWHNLVHLHGALEPQIRSLGAVVDRSYWTVCVNAVRRGPESEVRLSRLLHDSTRRERGG